MLRDCKWDVQLAVNNYYGGGSTGSAAPQSAAKTSAPVNVKQIQKIFDDFKGNEAQTKSIGTQKDRGAKHLALFRMVLFSLFVVGFGNAAAVLTIWCFVPLFCFIFLDEQDQILIDGMEKFCAALDVDPTDVVMLVMAWHLKAEDMCEFTRAGFVQGWTELKYVVMLAVP